MSEACEWVFEVKWKFWKGYKLVKLKDKFVRPLGDQYVRWGIMQHKRLPDGAIKERWLWPDNCYRKEYRNEQKLP